MSVNPFAADPAIRERMAALEVERGPAVRSAIASYFGAAKTNPDSNMGGVLPRSEVDAICTAHGIDADALMLLALKSAESFARPPISHFTVGAIGSEAGSGNLIFGGNLEFVGAHIGNTVHGEGFVFVRAFSRGTAIETIAIGEAHPCAHCRQFLSEFAATSKLTLIDPLGHRLSMAQLYPWPFDPDYLGEAGIVAGEVRHPDLMLATNELPRATAEKLTALGRSSYTPYGKAPAAILLSIGDGAMLGGAVIESVSFNPTMSPLQAAMIDLVAHGYAASDIAAATIAVQRDASVDYAEHARHLLSAIAPQIALDVVAWA